MVVLFKEILLEIRFIKVRKRKSNNQEILQNHLYQMSQNFETQACLWYAVKQIKSISADKGNKGTRLRKPLLSTHVVLSSDSSVLVRACHRTAKIPV